MDCSSLNTDILLEFFEVCFHSILFLRKVYPSSIFTLKKKYNVPVHICLYPDLNNYISEVLKCLRNLLILNQVREIRLSIFDTTLKPIENYVFSNINTKNASSLFTDSDSINLNELEIAFRTFCLKLSITDDLLKSTQENSTFRIFIKTIDSGFSTICDDTTFEGFPWIAEENIPNKELKGIIPIQSLHNPTFQFDLYAEI